MDFFPEIDVTPEQAEAIARGLYAVARAEGGIHEMERALLMSLYSEATGGQDFRAFSTLESAADVTPEELCAALPSQPLRVLFIKSCLLLGYADNHLADSERKLIETYGSALQIEKSEVDELERDVKQYLVGHLMKLSNTEAVIEVSKKLGE